MSLLVLIRHGESEWNRDNRFTGWRDIDLTDRGREEAKFAGRLLREDGFIFDVAYTSVLKRAIKTLWILLEELDLAWIPIHASWRLNERHYGALEGFDKTAMAEKFGRDQVHSWRRSFDERPPAVDERDANHPRFDRRYHSVHDEHLPATESLRDVYNRFLPLWAEKIEAGLQRGERTLIVAHENSLRALVKLIDGLSDSEVLGMNLPTGTPRIYELDDQLRPVNGRFHPDVDDVQRRIDQQISGFSGPVDHSQDGSVRPRNS